MKVFLFSNVKRIDYFIFMKKFVRVSSQPTFIPMLGNKMKSQTEDDPEKSLNIDTQPQKKLALFLKHTLMNILMRKKN